MNMFTMQMREGKAVVQVKFPTNWLLSKSSNVIQNFEITQAGTPIGVLA